MTSVYVGDIPVAPMRIAPAAVLHQGLTAHVSLTGPLGWSQRFPGETTVMSDYVIVKWPTFPLFLRPGVYSLYLTLKGAGTSETFGPYRIVAEDRDGWHSLASARSEWRDAPTDDVQLYKLLSIAREQVEEFAPVYAPTEWEDIPVPFAYLQAQLLQARNIWNAGKVDPSSGGFGDDTFVIRPFPLDWTVKQLLRPVGKVWAI